MEQQHLGSPTGGYVMSSRSALQPDLTYYSELQPPADTYSSQAGISDAGVELYVEQTLTEVLQRAQSRAGSQGLPESMWHADARQQQQACLAEAQQPQGHRLGFARGPAKRGAVSASATLPQLARRRSMPTINSSCGRLPMLASAAAGSMMQPLLAPKMARVAAGSMMQPLLPPKKAGRSNRGHRTAFPW